MILARLIGRATRGIFCSESIYIILFLIRMSNVSCYKLYSIIFLFICLFAETSLSCRATSLSLRSSKRQTGMSTVVREIIIVELFFKR